MGTQYWAENPAQGLGPAGKAGRPAHACGTAWARPQPMTANCHRAVQWPVRLAGCPWATRSSPPRPRHYRYIAKQGIRWWGSPKSAGSRGGFDGSRDGGARRSGRQRQWLQHGVAMGGVKLGRGEAKRKGGRK
jgi:hypothetical protein